LQILEILQPLEALALGLGVSLIPVMVFAVVDGFVIAGLFFRVRHLASTFAYYNHSF
jgi:hypothetical protein